MIAFLYIIFNALVIVHSSSGDRSSVYVNCLIDCEATKCTSKASLDLFYMKQQRWMHLIGWTCIEECKYHCMWPTVEHFQNQGLGVPKFYGKWPFLRIIGAQEIVSSIASILNLIPHVVMMKKFRKTFNRSYPMYYAWQMFALININAWFWSFMFHVKDTPFTEKMDYFSAFSLILSNLYFYIIRMTSGNTVLHQAIGIIIMTFLFYHIYYMSFVHFDYGYNVKVAVVIGLSTLIGWTLWYIKVRREQPYTSNVIVCSVSASLLMLLEIFDFSPVLWLFDAHAMWHISTAPLPYFWYRFVFDDLRHLRKKKVHFT